MTPTVDITAVLAAHELWVRGGTGGRRAYLGDANLSGANLSGANLSGAYLSGTCVDLLLKDDGRGYQVVAHRGLTSDGEALYLAGCRQLTVTGARKHWGNPNHPHPQAAALILAAIETAVQA